MATIHYLNVKNGDCSIIRHNDGKITVIDVNNATKSRQDEIQKAATEVLRMLSERKGNYNQKEYPVNPVEYFAGLNISSVFRFILTHPDMDHMDGIKDFFDVFNPINFWDTDNTKPDMDFNGSPYNEDDWKFYKAMRDGTRTGPKRLTLLQGAKGKYYNENESGESGGNGLYILAPTRDLVDYANENESFNDISYVLLYKVHGRRILFGGDADNRTWAYLLENNESDIKDVDLLIAPHHGRKSSCSYEFLRTVNPKMTFFGNTDKASHLATDMFNRLRLPKISNNEGNCLIADTDENGLHIYVTYKRYAESRNPRTFYNEALGGYFVQTIN